MIDGSEAEFVFAFVEGVIVADVCDVEGIGLFVVGVEGGGEGYSDADGEC